MVEPFFRSSVVSGAERAGFDAGLRAHMQRVFAYMAGGLGITGALAMLVASSPDLAALLLGTPLRFLVMMAPLGFIMYLNFRLDAMSAAKAQGIFWAFCATMGMSMAAIFLVFTGADIARAFFITAGTFGAMSLWGYTTKQDLSSMGAFLMMGVLGILLASVVNIFLGSNQLQWIVSVAGVAIFTGLTAFDVQRIKQTYASAWGDEANNKLAVIGALQLYLNFINAFQFLLSLLGGGGRRD